MSSSSLSTTLDENFLSQLLPDREPNAIRNWVLFLQQQEIRTLADASRMSENDWSTGCGNIPIGVRTKIREVAQDAANNSNNTINSGVPSSSSSSSATTTGTTSATLPTMMNSSNNTDAYVRQQQQYHYQPQLYSFQAPPPHPAVPAYNNTNDNNNNNTTSSFLPLPQYPPPASENNNQQEKYYHFEAPPPACYQPSAYQPATYQPTTFQPSNMMMQEQEKNKSQNEYLKQRRQDQQQERQEQRGGHPQYHPSHHHHHHHHQQHHQQGSVTATTSGTRASRATGTRGFRFEIRDPVLAEEFFTKSVVPKLVNPPRDRDIYDRFVRHWGGFDPWDRQNNHCGRCHAFASKLEGNGEHMESHHPSDRCPYYNERGEEMKQRWAANSKEFIRSAEDFLHRYRQQQQQQQQHHQQAEPVYYKGFLIKFPFRDPVLVEKFFLQENLPHTEEEQQLTQDIKNRLIAHWNGFNPWLQHQCARCWKYTSKISGNGRFYAANHKTHDCPWWDEEGNATSRSRELVQYYHNHHLFREAAREYLEKHQLPPQHQQHQEQQHGGGRGDSEDYSTLFENPNHDGQRGSQEFNRDLYSQRRQRE